MRGMGMAISHSWGQRAALFLAALFVSAGATAKTYTIKVDAAFVHERLMGLVEDQDLSRYIL